LDSNLLKTKSIEALVDDVEKGKHLKRTLTAFDLTLLGIGAIIGTGIFVLTGTAPPTRPGRRSPRRTCWPGSPAPSPLSATRSSRP